MPTSIEQRIIDRVVARMQTISVVHGYQTDIGTHVEDSRPKWDEKESLPAISVFEGTVTSDDTNAEGTMVIRTMRPLIKCFLKRLDTAAADAAFARKTISDIYAAIATDPLWIDSGVPLAIRTTEISHGIEYVEGTMEITGTQVEIEIRYEARAFNMYTD